MDLALVLAVDGSASVTFEEFNLIAGGLGAALRDPEVTAALLSGPRGASLCALLLFSGEGAQEVMVDWTRVADVGAVAALAAAGGLLGRLPAAAGRRVVDVASDGSSNQGPPAAPERDRLVAGGATVNGLCVLHEEPDLVAWYGREVVGGPGAFALACADYAGFADAMRRKLLREALVA